MHRQEQLQRELERRLRKTGYRQQEHVRLQGWQLFWDVATQSELQRQEELLEARVAALQQQAEQLAMRHPEERLELQWQAQQDLPALKEHQDLPE